MGTDSVRCAYARSRPAVKTQDRGNLESLATDKDFEDLIVERGAVHAFVDLMRTGVRHDVNAAAYAACANLMDSRAARRVLAVEGGVQVCVCLLIRCQPTP